MSERVWTLGDILRTASQFLQEKGIEGPRRSAELMLGKVLALPRIELYLQHERPLTEEEIAAYRELLRRRSHHEPLQVILGSVEFLGTTIEVPPGLLVPRPETEELAERVVGVLRDMGGEGPIRALDVGTGTGCLAVAIAAGVPRLHVDAVDVDYEAVRGAARNAERNKVGERVRAILADFFSAHFIAAVHAPYDLVVSNPPYVAEADFAALPLEVHTYERRHALNGGHDGLAHYRRMSELVSVLLRPGGILALEIGFGQQDAVSALLSGHIERWNVHCDLSGIPRIMIGRRTGESSSKSRDS